MRYGNTSDAQYKSFHERFKQYKNLVFKTKRKYTMQTKISNLKKMYLRGFRNIFNSATKYKYTEIDCATFSDLIEHFRELNSDLMLSGIFHPICDTAFTIDEIKSLFKKLENNKTSGVYNVVIYMLIQTVSN